MKKLIRNSLLCSTFVLAGFFLNHPQQNLAATRINVTEDDQFPVDGTDTEQDYTNLQNILNRIRDAKEEVIVYLPAGTYYLPQSLRVYSYTHLILDEHATLIRMDEGIDKNILHNVDDNGQMDQTGGYKMSHDITIEGGIWDGGDISKATQATDVVRFDHAKNITVKNCRFKNVYDCHLLEFIGVKNGLVKNCTFSNFRYKKGYEKDYMLAREALQLETAWTDDINDQTKAWARGIVLDGTSCQSVTVTGCTFNNMPCCVGQHHFTESGKYRNKDIEISNNTMTYHSSIKNGKTAITCSGMDGLKVFGNTITGDYHFAIHINAADDAVIKTNTMQGMDKSGIMINGGKRMVVTDNTIKHITKHGISCAGGALKSIDKNKISNVGEDGICYYGGSVKMITENTLNSIKKSGISILGGIIGSGTKKTTGIIKNTLNGCKLNGITVSRSARIASISRNKISNIKNNGISLTGNAKVTWMLKNTTKKCGKHNIWNGLKTKVKTKG